MKINKKNPKHWRALGISAFYSLLAATARYFLSRKKSEKIIIFYGHTLNGNLKAFFDYLSNKNGYRPYFLALDEEYYKRLRSNAEKPDTILLALRLKDMILVAKAEAFVTSHGLHFFTILRALTNIKFIDVWHAVSFKGWESKHFRHLHPHDETWVASPFLKKMYIDKFGFDVEKVRITGYARTDQLINGKLNKKEIIKKYRIPKAKKYILIAPTWKQDHAGRSVLPFGMSEDSFFEELDQQARNNSSHIIFRTHLNSDDDLNVDHLENTSFMPYSKYEVVEEFLFIADVLVTDWSSIGIDYLVLKRPAIFLDVPPPFKNGFELGPEHRYGDIAKNFADLKTYIVRNIKNPEDFYKTHNEQIKETTKAAYGETLDGKSTERYFKCLEQTLKNG